MIKYALVCSEGHAFEGWFSASADYDDQKGRGLLECPMCGAREVGKQIMSPAVAGTKKRSSVDGSRGDGPPDGPTREVMMEVMGKVRAHVEENFDYMGDSFASEARAIHEGRSEERGIYGEATAKEVRDLAADGVPVAALPPKKSEVN